MGSNLNVVGVSCPLGPRSSAAAASPFFFLRGGMRMLLIDGGVVVVVLHSFSRSPVHSPDHTPCLESHPGVRPRK